MKRLLSSLIIWLFTVSIIGIFAAGCYSLTKFTLQIRNGEQSFGVRSGRGYDKLSDNEYAVSSLTGLKALCNVPSTIATGFFDCPTSTVIHLTGDITNLDFRWDMRQVRVLEGNGHTISVNSSTGNIANYYYQIMGSTTISWLGNTITSGAGVDFTTKSFTSGRAWVIRAGATIPYMMSQVLSFDSATVVTVDDAWGNYLSTRAEAYTLIEMPDAQRFKNFVVDWQKSVTTTNFYGANTVWDNVQWKNKGDGVATGETSMNFKYNYNTTFNYNSFLGFSQKGNYAMNIDVWRSGKVTFQNCRFANMTTNGAGGTTAALWASYGNIYKWYNSDFVDIINANTGSAVQAAIYCNSSQRCYAVGNRVENTDGYCVLFPNSTYSMIIGNMGHGCSAGAFGGTTGNYAGNNTTYNYNW